MNKERFWCLLPVESTEDNNFYLERSTHSSMVANVGFGYAIVTVIVAWQKFHSSVPFSSSGGGKHSKEFGLSLLCPKEVLCGGRWI